MRLIDADDFIEYLGLNAENSREENLGEIVTLEDFDRRPIIDAEPVRHSKWIPVYQENKRGGYECNLCHSYSPAYRNGDDFLSNYCPNCGAKMDLSD